MTPKLWFLTCASDGIPRQEDIDTALREWRASRAAAGSLLPSSAVECQIGHIVFSALTLSSGLADATINGVRLRGTVIGDTLAVEEMLKSLATALSHVLRLAVAEYEYDGKILPCVGQESEGEV